MKHREYILNHWNDVLQYLKSRFPIFHLSNIFFRDMQFGIHAFLAEQGMKVSYREAEPLAAAFMQKLEHEKIVQQLDWQTWVVRHPEFKTPVVVKQPAAPKPAPAPSAPARASAAPPSA